MKRILTAVVAIALTGMAVVGTGCGEREEPSTPYLKATQTYSNSQYGFSLEYPEDWGTVEDFPGFAVVFTGPYLQEYEFTVNISLEIGQFPGGVTMADLLQTVEWTTESKAEDYAKVGEYDTIIGGQSAKVFTVTATMEFNGRAVQLKDIGAIVIKDNVGYIITYDVPAKVHEEYKDCFELVIDSFRFE